MSTAHALPPLDPLLKRSAKRTRDIFASCPNDGMKEDEKRCVTSSGTPSTFAEEIFSARIRLSVKINDEYRYFKELPPALLAQQGPIGPARPKEQTKSMALIAAIDNTPKVQPSTFATSNKLSEALTLHKTTRTIKPTYHAPWKLSRVISGHLGWVRSVAVEPGNKWFATGAGDRVIKIWDLASGELKLSLTGHISTVRGLAVSPRHPYLFSCGEDKVSHSITRQPRLVDNRSL